MRRFFLLSVSLLLAACSHRAELRQLAAAGDSAAQYEYGRRLLSGTGGCPRNAALAVTWFNAAAQGGKVRARTALGLCYERGLGVPVSTEEARRCYEAAAVQGDRPACLALMRLEASQGRGKQSARWLKQLAEGDSPAAQLLYAKLCLSGLLGEGYEQAAVRYLRFAAMNGSAEACLLLSACYAEGRGVPKNDALMEGWYRNAVEAAQVGDL